ncbi:tripartite tricarboxylate transporter substrate binding protein [Salinarimonas rosea]|uniref:tripartite tricarboxylate transporter substrate binding protein n=1 Tax=Salinarimonas rosea TaxID=552063 RepID=UPI000406741A|nr:tripartite tricarboxylate transporter substrate binding protein [Salinarimonas rosea]
MLIDSLGARFGLATKAGRAALGAAALGLAALVAPQTALAWPDEPISIVVPFNAGGSADRMARGLAEHMGPRLGVPITVENRPGGGGALGATYFQQQEADGNTLLLMQATPYLSSAILVSGAPVQWEDFALLNAQWNDYAIVAVHQESPYETFAELAEAMREPGAVSSGIVFGNGGHIQTFILMDALDIPTDNVRFVTYDGGAPLRAALAGNQVDFEILAAEAAASIRDRIRVLAVVNTSDPGDHDAPLLNEALAEMGVEPVALIGGNITGLIAHAALKEEHPDRWQTLVDAYRETVESEDFQAWAREAKIGADWVGPDESQALVDGAFAALEPHAEKLR